MLNEIPFHNGIRLSDRRFFALAARLGAFVDVIPHPFALRRVGFVREPFGWHVTVSRTVVRGLRR